MHGLSRLGTGSNRSVSPSPPSSPRFRHGRYKNFAGGGGGVGRGGKQSAANKIVFVLISTVFRRKGVLLFAPLLYISGMLLYMGLLGFDVVSLKNAVVVVHRRSPPGSVYRSPQLFQKLWPHMEAESNATHNAICDAVAVAWLLNATLVIPIFHLNSVWRDSRELPEDVLQRFDNNISNIVNLRVKGWSSAAHYIQKVLPKLEAMGAVRIAPFSNRLAYSVPSNVQGVRERSWRGKFRRRGRVIRPGANRMDGKCPLTPLEVGLMLRGMGFNNNTSVFVAAGNIYKAEKYMAPLKQMFPLLETKNTLTTPEELAPFKGHSSRLAALDYTVCLHSEVFVTTQGGNFPHFLMGHRRYLFGGHAKTIKPDKRKLALLFDSPHIRNALARCFASNECLGSTLSTNLLRATKKVRNKDDESVANVDQVMKEPKPCKVSFKDMLMGSGKEEKYEDVHLSLEDDDEITFIEANLDFNTVSSLYLKAHQYYELIISASSPRLRAPYLASCQLTIEND
ncbi:hypothetical protein GOBAR_AA32443 [Gossypium barbadense]|uniref:O-fucosyltransferase family protein n=1 Tax=Gossypium barbadense TaxID=3634 RepID=A0A2P5WAX7_GOSBA|nr:hypothetical protein GOBAR_AA32443 [Gossypium barbadense]